MYIEEIEKKLIKVLCGADFLENNGLEISGKKWNKMMNGDLQYCTEKKKVILLSCEGVIEVVDEDYEVISCGDRTPSESMKKSVEQLRESLTIDGVKIFLKYGKFVKGAGEV